MNENCYLGIEFGSTRIKAQLIDENYKTVSSGSHTWESKLKNGYYTYSEIEIKNGLQTAFKALEINQKKIESICISAMMHGFLAFDKNMNLLTDFRTWQNVNTEKAASILSEELQFNIPLRWSCAHLYQAVIDNEEYVSQIDHVTTLAGYVHYLLTGEKVLGIGDASGMFPIKGGGYDRDRADIFNNLLKQNGFDKNIFDLFPKILSAGETAGTLTAVGARLLDPTGTLKPGITFAPPEGDAGTGMVATNSVRPLTGNISAGTSVFSMAVLDKPLAGYYPEIDMVTTPDGADVAMVHCNNCSGSIDVWVHFLADIAKRLGNVSDMDVYYQTFFNAAKTGNTDNLCSYGFLSPEPIAGIKNPIEQFIKAPGSLTLPDLSRAILYSALCTLVIGMEKLFSEGVKLDKMYGHGGYFKSEGVGAQIAADALNVPVAVGVSAGEGGAYGAALLAAYLYEDKLSLADYLSEKIFKKTDEKVYKTNSAGRESFLNYLNRFRSGLNKLQGD